MGVPVVGFGRHDWQVKNEEKIVAKTCKNCGAPLREDKCEYCGTEYENAKEKRGSEVAE